MIVKIIFYILALVSFVMFFVVWYEYGYPDAVYLLGTMVFYLAARVIYIEDRLDSE